MIINKEERTIEFNYVLRSATSINEIPQTIKVDRFSFANDNSKGDFMSINSVEDLKVLHTKGMKFAASICAMD